MMNSLKSNKNFQKNKNIFKLVKDQKMDINSNFLKKATCNLNINLILIIKIISRCNTRHKINSLYKIKTDNHNNMDLLNIPVTFKL